MTNEAKNTDPLHGVSLETIMNCLVKFHGWQGLYERIKINCFATNPSIKSSLTFLRKTPWARQKVELLYCYLKPKDRAGFQDQGVSADTKGKTDVKQ